ncbi:MAG: hypothetical protein ABSC20_12455 [Candidatus Bathyarchaeia archaeon]|jgi:hypothetical protein
MVDAERVKRKLPSLLIDGSTTKKKEQNSLMRYRYRLKRFQKRNPEKCDNLTNKLIDVLKEIKKAVSE